MIDEHRPQYGQQESDVPKSLKFPLIVRFGHADADLPGRAMIIPGIYDVKPREQKSNGHQPHRPATLRNPPERNAFQIAEEQWRISYRRQTSTYVGHDEDKKNNVVRG